MLKSCSPIHQKGQLMKPIIIMLSMAFGAIIIGNAHALTVYQSTGKYGEPRYSQFPPSGAYRTLHLPQSKNAKPAPTDKQKQCQILHDNLMALNAGGIIHEIDKQGNKTELTPEQIKERKTQTEQALQAHCQT